jgi:membrane protease YdiL (CAAX protease family)
VGLAVNERAELAFQSDADIADWFREATGSPAQQPDAPPPAAALRHPKAGRRAFRTVIVVIFSNIAVQLALITTAHAHHWTAAATLRTSLFAAGAFYAVVGGIVAVRADDLAVRPVWLVGPARTAIGVGAAVGGCVAVGLTALSTLASHHLVVDPLAGTVAASRSLVLLAGGSFVMAVAAPIAEEFVFRGFLAEALRGRGRKVALLVSAAAFSLAHLRFSQFRYYLAVGIGLGVLYWGRGLIASISAHATFNGMLVLFAVASVHGPSHAFTAGNVRVRLPATWHEVNADTPTDFVAVGPGTAQVAISHVDIPAGASLDTDRLAAILGSGHMPLPNEMELDTRSVRVRTDLPMGPAVAARSTVHGHDDRAVLTVTHGRLVIFEILDGANAQASRDFDRMLHSARPTGVAE